MLQAKGLQNIRFSDRIMEPKYIDFSAPKMYEQCLKYIKKVVYVWRSLLVHYLTKSLIHGQMHAQNTQHRSNFSDEHIAV